MRKRKKGITPAQVVIGAVVLICIIFVVNAVVKSKNNKVNNDNGAVLGGISENGMGDSDDNYVVDVEGEENVKVNSQGVKENTSDNLKKEQDLNGLKIKNTSITYTNGISTIKADITNKTGANIEEVGIINIKVKDSSGNVVREMSTYVMGLKEGETKEINASITSEIVNASEIEFSI